MTHIYWVFFKDTTSYKVNVKICQSQLKNRHIAYTIFDLALYQRHSLTFKCKKKKKKYQQGVIILWVLALRVLITLTLCNVKLKHKKQLMFYFENTFFSKAWREIILPLPSLKNV